MGSTASGVNPNLIGHRLTNLTQLTLDTSWWTRYRDDSHNADPNPNYIFPQAVPSLFVNQHTVIPRTDADTSNPHFLQAIAILRRFTFQPSNKLEAAFTYRWRKGLPMWKCCVS
jgi:hypothetical protein